MEPKSWLVCGLLSAGALVLVGLPSGCAGEVADELVAGDGSGSGASGGSSGSSGSSGSRSGSSSFGSGSSGSGSGDSGDSSSGSSSSGSGGGDEDDEDSSGDHDDDPPPVNNDIPPGEYCDPVSDWDAEWIAFEEEVLHIVNERRAEGANCGSAGSFGPAGPLEMEPHLRCAARVHSKDMFDRDFFDHTNPDGEGPGARMDKAGYEGRGWGENIAWGQTDPQDVMDGWMGSDGHCSNIMNDGYSLIGVGYYPSDEGWGGGYWTQTFGG